MLLLKLRLVEDNCQLAQTLSPLIFTQDCYDDVRLCLLFYH
jgi:hypothetical protein